MQAQPFIDKYIAADKKIMEFYDYPVNEEGLEERLKELRTRDFNREQLVDSLTKFNEKFTNCERTFHQIHKLNDERSVVVVGGQQAGLLTGPVYTINKIISILHEANRLEETLHIPVVPVFWIAGEDHDIDEVNHLHVHNGADVKKFFFTRKK